MRNKRRNAEPISTLEEPPLQADELAVWMALAPEAKFDAVCVSATTLCLVDERVESGFVSVRSVAVLMTAMRDRYRAIVQTADSGNIAMGAA